MNFEFGFILVMANLFEVNIDIFTMAIISQQQTVLVWNPSILKARTVHADRIHGIYPISWLMMTW